MLCLVPLLLLAAGAKVVAHDELITFIIHVHPHENRKTWYESFLPDEGRLVHAYHHIASGFAAQLTPEELDEMSTMPGFVSAVPDQTYTPHTPQFLGLDVIQGNVSDGGVERGAGVIIGIIDTGVFPFHPSFSDAGGMPPPPSKWAGRCEFNNNGSSVACNNKLIGARSFVSRSNGTIIPLDDSGHGTHAASTAAGAAVPGANVLGQGLGVATGMAPRAHLAAYKVCHELFCRGSDVLAGIDAAVADGCDVVSVSLAGPQSPSHKDPVAIGTFGAMQKGVFVSMAAGNFGPSTRSLRNEAPWALTVAASTMDRSIRSTVRLGNGLSFHGETAYQPDGSSSAFFPLVYADASGNPLAELCGTGSLDGMDVKGKIVLCEYWSGPGGNNTRIMKGAVVKNAGGAGMIVLNNFTLGYSTLAEPHVLPASHIDYPASLAIMSYLNSTANPVVQIVFGGTVLGTSPAPSIAFFSSRGPSVQDPGILKPDITGPGVNVLAAWPFKVGPTDQTLSGVSGGGPTFNFLPGTSISTAHLSGIAAIIKSKYPDWSPAAIKSAIMTTADVTDRSGNPILDEKHQPADWFATGAGHVNPESVMTCESGSLKRKRKEKERRNRKTEAAKASTSSKAGAEV
ncbi:hypothetical protein EJB05_34885, partial [Eragrostis curvula]